MSRVNTLQGAFSAGEVSPRLWGRQDLEKYASALALCKNFILQPTGGLYRRSGTVFGAEVKDSLDNVRLFPYLVADENGNAQGFVIEAGDNYFRFYTENGQLVDGMGDPVEISSVYPASYLALMDYAQSADTLFFVHRKVRPSYTQRTGVLTFQSHFFDYQDGPYMDINTNPDWTLDVSADTGTVTITAAGTGFTPFVSTDVGRWIRVRTNAKWGCAQITVFTSSTVVQAKVLPSFPFDSTADPTVDWRLGSWSETTGWPGCIIFHEGRLYFGGTDTEPQAVWASKSAVFNQFSPTNADLSVTDDCGFSYTLNSSTRNSIQYLISSRSLMIGTYGADWCVRSTNANSPITPTNIAFQQQTQYGAAKIRPFLIGTSVIYVQRSTQKLREQSYDYSNDGYNSIEISLLSEHLIRQGGGIVESAYQQEPDSLWWGCRADGTLIGMTYMKDQKIVGFHQHVIGGTYNGGQAQVKSICTIPHPDGTQDQLWMIVKRTINNETVQYVEYLDKPFNPDNSTDYSLMNFVDCGAKYLGSPATHIDGLDYLVGETVTICGDGNEQPAKLVANDGTIDLQSEASLAYIGLPFNSDFTVLPTPVQGDFGTGVGKIKRIDCIYLRVLNSMTFKSGADLNNLRQHVFTNTSSLLTTATPLSTELVKVYHPGSYQDDAQFSVRQDRPYPLNVLCSVAQLVVAP